jgi:hypothetical protein
MPAILCLLMSSSVYGDTTVNCFDGMENSLGALSFSVDLTGTVVDSQIPAVPQGETAEVYLSISGQQSYVSLPGSDSGYWYGSWSGSAFIQAGTYTDNLSLQYSVTSPPGSLPIEWVPPCNYMFFDPTANDGGGYGNVDAWPLDACWAGLSLHDSGPSFSAGLQGSGEPPLADYYNAADQEVIISDSSGVVTVTPEPTSSAMLTSALLGLVGYLFARRRRAA